MVAETDPGAGREAGPAAEVPPVTAHALRHARLAAIHENGVASLLFSVALMLVCATLLLGSVDTGALGLWLAAGLGSVAVRLPFAVRARRLLATGAELPGTSTLVLSLGTAAVYGSLALFHEPGLPVVAQLALVLFPIAVTVGIVPAYGHWPAMFHAFAGVTLLPLLAVLLLSDAPAIRLLAVPVVLFLVGEALVVGRDAANAAERLRLRLGNEALVARLTERAADLEAARDAARQASAAKSEFLARMSHELRTPLNGVLGMSQLLAGSDLDDLQRRRLATLEASGRTLLELVDRLLDMARLQAHELVLEPRPIRLDALLERLGERFGPRARAAGLELELALDPGAPATARLDPVRIEQVLAHLVDNALKFTERGTVSVRVAGAGDGRLLVIVEDTGIGVDPALARSMFDLFVQGDGTDSRRHGGTGLGLAIVSELVRLMDGTVRATGTPGVGTRVVLELPPGVGAEGAGESVPLAREAAPGDGAPAAGPVAGSAVAPVAEPAAEPGPDAAGAPGTAGARVLVAEDNAVNRLVVQAILEELGCAVELVDDGARALGAIGRRRPDLVLMDCQMPVLDGYEATRRLRAAGDDVPIVALTANALEGDRERCLAAGMDDYLTKPIDREPLAAAIERWRGGRSTAARRAA